MTTIASDTVAVPVSRGRRIAFTVLALLLAALTGLMMDGAPSLIRGFTASGEDVVHRIHHNHWGVLMTVVVALPLVALARRPSIAPVQQVAVAILAVLAASIAAGVVTPPLLLFPVLVGLLLWLHPARHLLGRRGAGFSRPLGALAGLVTVPAVWYAIGEIQTHLAAPLSDPHRGPPEYHYITGAAIALTVAGVAWLISARTAGWRLSAWTLAASMILLGGASVAYPDYVSSLGRVGGALAVAWGAAVIVAAEADRRRDRTERR